jgi:Zn-dependent alcohol dehydrogenase
LWAISLGGKHIQIGICPPDAMVGIPLTFLTAHCNSIVGTQYGMIQTDRDIPAFADMAMRGDLLLDKLITKMFKVEEINDVAEAMKARQIKGRWVCEW